MENIQLDKKMIENYKELPVGKYLEILKVVQDESIDDIDKKVKIISILSDMEEEYILNIPIMEVKEMVVKTQFLEKPIVKDLHIAKEYKIGDLSLVPVTDINKITTAQYIDFNEYTKMGDDKLVEILSCLLIPKGKKYNQDYDVLEVQKEIRENLSVTDVLSIASFFIDAWRKLITDSLISSKREAMRIPEKERRDMMLNQINRQLDLLKTNGVG